MNIICKMRFPYTNHVILSEIQYTLTTVNWTKSALK